MLHNLEPAGFDRNAIDVVVISHFHPDHVNGLLAADIERVCTHSSFRKRGFARAVIQECLDRLRDMGMRSAYITGYSSEAIALYGSLGALDEQQSFIYEMAAS